MQYQGKWALVTGASSGIGRAFARELAHRGANVILVAVDAAGLKAVASELQSTYGIETMELPADLSREAAPNEIAGVVAKTGREVLVLINAAGFGTRGPSHTLKLATEHAQAMVNAVAVAQLTYLFLPGMVARGEGTIVNVGSSSASFWPGPYMAMYGATKAFVLSFTKALWGEYHRSGLRITALCPAPTDTGFHRGDGFTSQGTTSPAVNAKKRTPEQAVQSAFAALEKDNPYVVDTMWAYWRAQLPRLLPAKLAIHMAARSLRQS